MVRFYRGISSAALRLYHRSRRCIGSSGVKNICSRVERREKHIAAVNVIADLSLALAATVFAVLAHSRRAAKETHSLYTPAERRHVTNRGYFPFVLRRKFREMQMINSTRRSDKHSFPYCRVTNHFRLPHPRTGRSCFRETLDYISVRRKKMFRLCSPRSALCNLCISDNCMEHLIYHRCSLIIITRRIAITQSLAEHQHSQQLMPANLCVESLARLSIRTAVQQQRAHRSTECCSRSERLDHSAIASAAARRTR